MKIPARVRRVLVASCVLGLGVAGRAQTPAYRTEFLGTAGAPTDLNHQGVVVGTSTISGNLRAYVVSRGLPVTELPLPPGRISSTAAAINEHGWIVGAVGSAYSPEFSGRAALWTPDGSGGYLVQELGVLPGHAQSSGTTLNDVGDVLGWSQSGLFRTPVRFVPGGAPQSLAATGIFDPVDVNDARRVLDRSADGKVLDLNTMVVTTLGVPQGFPTHYNAVQGRRINASGQVGAIAHIATSGSCSQHGARWTAGIGWEIFGPCGVAGGIGDMNDFGEATMVWTTTSIVQLDGHGAIDVSTLLSAPVGQWTYPLYTVFRINNGRQLAGWAHNTTTDEAGVVLLTPDAGGIGAFCAGDGSAGTCPCGNVGGPARGCANSVQPLGAQLDASGSTSLANDGVLLRANGMPDSSALYFQGTEAVNGGAGLPFGDGLRCAGGTIVRLATRTNSGGTSSYPASGDAPVSVRGLVTAPCPRRYQVWYRNAATYCTPATYNLTNALLVTWSP